MIGVIIGSGIFRTPLTIAAGLPSPPLILALWALGGLICLAGALTYAELAAMLPASGGVYVFLREAYGRTVAFVFGWSYLLLVKPFAAGGIAFVFAEHLGLLLDVPARAAALAADHPGWTAEGLLGLWNKGITTVMLLGLTVINLRGVGLSTAFSGALSAVKFAALAAIVVLTCALRPLGGALAGAAPGDGAQLLRGVIAAMSAILWTYDGWADVGAIAGEVKDPQRTLPRVYIAGTAAVVAVYVLVNLAYFAVVPAAEMVRLNAAPAGESVAPLAVGRLIGPLGATAVVVVIMLSTLGSSHASVMTGARVSYAQARDGLLFRFIGHVHPRWLTPDASLLAQVALAILAVWTLGSFQSLMDGFVFTMWIFYGLAGAAIFVLRRTRPDAPRPFRCPGYPAVPALFVLAALGMFVLSIARDPGHTLPWLGVLAAGVPVYWVWRARTAPRAECHRCGQDLAALPSGAPCPNCGR
jgi:APA family basic amino acid/polyamine antiporter